MKYFIAILILVMPILARGATCPAGQYPDNGECKYCNPNNEPFYCPGDDMRYDCPKTNTDYNALGYPNVVLSSSENTWARINSYSVYMCYGDMWYRTPDNDEYLMECPYNGENYYCSNKLWRRAGIGRYLSEYDFNHNTVFYFATKPCTNAPDNAHYTGSGTPDEPVKGGKTDYNDCPWACDDGYGRHNDECLPLCASGATRFHVGDYVFNIYKEKLTSLAINIGFSDGTVCYVPLVEGLGKGALNVDYHGTVYHTSD